MYVCVCVVSIHVYHVCMPCIYVECIFMYVRLCCVWGEWNLCNYGVCIWGCKYICSMVVNASVWYMCSRVVYVCFLFGKLLGDVYAVWRVYTCDVECVCVIKRVHMCNCVSMHTLSFLSMFWIKKYFRNIKRHCFIFKKCVLRRLCIFVFQHKAIILVHSQRQPSWTFGENAQNNTF